MGRTLPNRARDTEKGLTVWMMELGSILGNAVVLRVDGPDQSESLGHWIPMGFCGSHPADWICWVPVSRICIFIYFQFCFLFILMDRVLLCHSDWPQNPGLKHCPCLNLPSNWDMSPCPAESAFFKKSFDWFYFLF
jgi:hypothetical protein